MIEVDTPTLDFFVPGTPAPAGSKRAFRNPRTGGMIVTDANAKTKPWQAAVRASAVEAMERAELELLTGPLGLHLIFYVTRPKGHYGTGRNEGRLKDSAPQWPAVKPDVLKLTRAVEDALTGIVYRDDAQIVTEMLAKEYGSPEGVAVEVREW